MATRRAEVGLCASFVSAMQTRPTLRLEPHLRITLAGCSVSVKNFTDVDGVVKHLICLTRAGSPVTCASASRNGQYTCAEMETRILNGSIARWSSTYAAMVELAEFAEQLYGAEVA